MSVVVQLQLGHTAIEKDRPTKEGYTHDWKVFVRGPNDCAIEYFIEKVVFHLHDSFPKPKRVKKEPPFQVSESGYAGFTMPIDVYFRTKEEPKKVSYIYDLYLRVGEKVSNIRLEKLTFQNPVEEFRKKLLLGGGVSLTCYESFVKANQRAVLACFVAENSLPFSPTAKLVELCQTLAKDRPSLSKLKMEMTAATYITGHGVAKTMREELVAKLYKNYFSMNVDEATNNSGDKIINVLVRVYDDEKEKNHNCSSRFKKRKHIHCKTHIFCI
ncbi:Protein ENL [Araneus ventricosus]|uniref:Protein ENL n=1 Tax=Araneus ventricosus TaxID=182803 RepID=A0A4Y2E174_ARAVE|nr:Protein ENL [Araneus ventricosus]